MRIPKRNYFCGLTNDYSIPKLKQKVKMISEGRVWENNITFLRHINFGLSWLYHKLAAFVNDGIFLKEKNIIFFKT